MIEVGPTGPHAVQRRDRGVVPISALEPPAHSPRSAGEQQAHIMRLAETEANLPPILVQRHTLRIIDGMHRLRAAQLNGQKEITVEYFDGDDDDAFMLAVELNIGHGLPLSLADRKAAAARILAARPHVSDGLVASTTGLASKTVAAIRRRATRETPELHSRLGADGRLRPVDATDGRRRAAELLAKSPDSSLREIASVAGISPGTVRDVRDRMQRGEEPARVGTAADRGSRRMTERQIVSARRPIRDANGRAPRGRAMAIWSTLAKDPSLRLTEGGRGLLRWLHCRVISKDDVIRVADEVPPCWSRLTAEFARELANAWTELAGELERRARDEV